MELVGGKAAGQVGQVRYGTGLGLNYVAGSESLNYVYLLLDEIEDAVDEDLDGDSLRDEGGVDVDYHTSIEVEIPASGILRNDDGVGEGRLLGSCILSQGGGHSLPYLILIWHGRLPLGVSYFLWYLPAKVIMILSVESEMFNG